MARLMPNGKQQYFDSNGDPLVGGKVYTYAVGTSTLKATYTNAAGTVESTNPIILNARGEAEVYWAGAYKVAVYDASNVLIYTIDNYSTQDPSSVSAESYYIGGETYQDAMIQRAIDAVYAAGGGEVALLATVYTTNAAINLKRGVSLIGSTHKVSNAQLYESNAEATIYGVTRILPTVNVTTAAILADFTLATRLERPYGVVLRNIFIDSRNQGAGDCFKVVAPPALEGPFDTGWASTAVRAENCYFIRAPGNGATVISTATEKTNCWFKECRFAFNGGHGLYAYLCFDMFAENCMSLANTGDGMHFAGCATERILHCDVFSNTGHGLTLDGFDGIYRETHAQINGKHGFNIICTTSSTTSKRYRIIGGRIDGNSQTTDNTYDNVYIGDLAGAGISGVLFADVSFGMGSASLVNKVRSEVYSSVLPVQFGNTMTGCSVANNDLKAGNTSFNDAFWQSCNFSSTVGGDGQVLASKPRPLAAWAGSASPNVLRGTPFYKTANVAGAVISGLTHSTATFNLGREIWILIDDVNTGVDFTGSTLKGNGGVDLAAGAGTSGKVLHCKNYDGTNWAVTIYG